MSHNGVCGSVNVNSRLGIPAAAMADAEMPGTALLARRSVYSTAQCQTFLLGLICFCVPGMWNAITSAAGGIRNQEVATEAMSALYACFTATSLLAPVVTNTVGLRLTLGIGSIGYIFYVATLFLYSQQLAVNGLVVAAGAINGVGAGLLWTAQGALVMAYPSAESKGRLFGLFWAVFNLGGVFGGLLWMGMNFEHSRGHASPATFAIFGGIMVAGAGLCGALLPLRAVVRPDGTRPPPPQPSSVCPELRAMACLVVEWQAIALIPLFLYSNFFYAFQFACFNGRIFSARTQGLNNAAYWGAQMGGAVGIGSVLDTEGRSLRLRACTALLGIAMLVATTWGTAAWAVSFYELDGPAPPARLDAFDAPRRWAAPFLIYLSWGLGDSLVQSFVYWLLGQLEGTAEGLSRWAGLYKSVQSAGAAIAWALSTRSWRCEDAGAGCTGGVPPSTQVLLNAALAAVALPGLLLVICRAPALADRAALRAAVQPTAGIRVINTAASDTDAAAEHDVSPALAPGADVAQHARRQRVFREEDFVSAD